MKTILRLTIAVALILAVPLVAMQFTDEVNWSALDFAVAAVLLFGAAGVYAFAAKLSQNSRYRAAVGVTITAVLLLIWAQLAVGIL